MTRTTILFALAAAAAFLALPAADAQQQGYLSLRVANPTNALAAGTTTNLPGAISATFDNTATITQTAGIPLSYSVTRVPNGTTVTISPATDVIPTDLGPQSVGISRTETRPFTITIQVGKDAPADALDTIEIVATTHGNTGSNPFSARTIVPVHLVNDGAACPPAMTSAAAPPTEATQASSTSVTANAPHAGGSSPATPVRLQSAAHTTSLPVAPAAAILGFAVVGAAVGLVVKRRRG